MMPSNAVDSRPKLVRQPAVQEHAGSGGRTGTRPGTRAERACWIARQITKIALVDGEAAAGLPFTDLRLRDGMHALVTPLPMQGSANPIEAARHGVLVDLWSSNQKVLSIEYDPNGSRLISMRPGAWEQAFMASDSPRLP